MSKYEVIIKAVDDNQSTKQDTTTSNNDTKNESSGFKQTIKTLRTAAAATGALMLTSKAINNVTSRVYTETGNRQWQDSVNAAKELGGLLLTIAGGFAMGGVLGGTVAIGGVVADYAFQLSNYAFAKNLESQVLSISRERMGVGGFNINQSRSATQ